MSIKTMTILIAAVLLLAVLTFPVGCTRGKGKGHAAVHKKHQKNDSQTAGNRQRSCTCRVSSSPAYTEAPRLAAVSE